MKMRPEEMAGLGDILNSSINPSKKNRTEIIIADSPLENGIVSIPYETITEISQDGSIVTVNRYTLYIDDYGFFSSLDAAEKFGIVALCNECNCFIGKNSLSTCAICRAPICPSCVKSLSEDDTDTIVFCSEHYTQEKRRRFKHKIKSILSSLFLEGE